MIYLDRLIQEAELFQAVARVNRTAPKKSYGLVVDYYGVFAQIAQALAVYTDADGALRPLSAEIGKARTAAPAGPPAFRPRGVELAATAEVVEACVLLLGDERLRADFDVALRTFLNTFDTVLPRPEALPFVDDVNLQGSPAHGGAPVSQPCQRFVRQSAGSCAGQYSWSGRSPAIAARIAGVAASPKRPFPWCS